MKKKLLTVLAGVGLIFGFTGCISTVEGEMEPGMPFMRDTITHRFEVPVDEVFQAARKVLAFNGTLYGENTIAHTLEAKIDTRTIWVSVSEVEPKTTRLQVQARTKGGLPDITLASEIATQIAVNLR